MIDRSKPLPIHEFQNLIDEVARLKELEAKATPSRWYLIGNRDIQLLSEFTSQDDFYINFDDSGREDPEFITEMRNAAPKLLDVLGEIRAGDTRRFDEIIEMIDFSIPSELAGVEEGDEEFDLAPSEYQEMIKMKETLHRYRDMAAQMEGTK
jgi:hypothetical protein